MTQRILITGAGGFVGTYLRATLGQRWPDAVIISTGPSAAEAAGGISSALDLRDAAAVDATVAAARPDVVVHLAAQASVGLLGREGDEQTWRVNLGGTLNLALSVAHHAPDATVLFASSSEVYGRAFSREPIDEAAVPHPTNAYAKGKLLGEHLLAAILPTTARLLVARPFNHTGPGQREDFVLPSWVGQVARIEAGLQAPAVRVGNLEAARDFLDVRDVVAAYGQLIEAAPRLPGRTTCNVASGVARPLHDLLGILQRASRVPFAITVDPARLRPSDTPFACGDSARLRALTGWIPTVPIEQTLHDMLQATRASLAGRPSVGADRRPGPIL